MTGLEKITERILAKGREDARLILQQAEQDCTSMANEYAARTEEMRAQITQQYTEMGERLVSDARDEAERMHEEILAAARAEVLDQVIALAKQKLCDSRLKYRELLVALLSSAMIEQDRAERERAQNGESPAATSRFDVLMNSRDHDILGADVVDDARRMLGRRIGADKASRIVLSHERLNIEGGLMLRYGDVMVDCSMATIFARVCEQMKDELWELLFTE